MPKLRSFEFGVQKCLETHENQKGVLLATIAILKFKIIQMHEVTSTAGIQVSKRSAIASLQTFLARTTCHIATRTLWPGHSGSSSSASADAKYANAVPKKHRRSNVGRLAPLNFNIVQTNQNAQSGRVDHACTIEMHRWLSVSRVDVVVTIDQEQFHFFRHFTLVSRCFQFAHVEVFLCIMCSARVQGPCPSTSARDLWPEL